MCMMYVVFCCECSISAEDRKPKAVDMKSGLSFSESLKSEVDLRGESGSWQGESQQKKNLENVTF